MQPDPLPEGRHAGSSAEGGSKEERGGSEHRETPPHLGGQRRRSRFWGQCLGGALTATLEAGSQEEAEEGDLQEGCPSSHGP